MNRLHFLDGPARKGHGPKPLWPFALLLLGLLGLLLLAMLDGPARDRPVPVNAVTVQ
jgi:hypothetical protein